MRGISIFQIHAKFSIVILAPELYIFSGPPTAASKQGFEEIAESVIVHVCAFERITLPFTRTGGCLTCFFKLLRVLPILAVLIVFFSLVGIAQHFIGLIDLL